MGVADARGGGESDATLPSSSEESVEARVLAQDAGPIQDVDYRYRFTLITKCEAAFLYHTSIGKTKGFIEKFLKIFYRVPIFGPIPGLLG